jgi:FdhD protein
MTPIHRGPLVSTWRRPGPSQRTRVWEFVDGKLRVREDQLATEEPLEIRLGWPGSPARRVVVTMRTPGADFELAAGFLSGEGLIAGSAHLRSVRYCLDPSVGREQQYNVVTVTLERPPLSDLASRYSAMSAACGVCGKQSLDDLATAGLEAVGGSARFVPSMLASLPDQLREQQAVFGRTGGLHAAAIHAPDGRLVVAREDVGRHNAVDKAVGHALLTGRAPLQDHLLCVSGRVGFEIVQKAVAARVAAIVAVGAPSSLAVQTAERFGVTLAGFARAGRFVVYTGEQRVALEDT